MRSIATVRIGTRGSRLAIAQAEIAAAALAGSLGSVELIPVSTRGDEISRRRRAEGWVETDGQFTRELGQALLDGSIDVAVHSYKDMPTATVDGLVIGAVLPRADARDCLIARDGAGLDELPFGTRVGTSSPRRAAQIAASRPDLIAVPLRGNVESRLRRVESGDLDAVILAAAGLDRLGIAVADAARLPFDVVLPAPAQGALALECRADDDGMRRVLATVNDAATRIAVEAERSLLRRLGGGCLAPLGALGEVDGDDLHLRAAYEDRFGTLRRAEAHGRVSDAAAIVEAVAGLVAEA